MKRKSHAFVPVVFLVLLLCLYYPVRQAGFVTDWNGWQIDFDRGTFTDAFRNFGRSANLQVAAIAMFTMYKIAGLNGWVWYALVSVLHAVNGYLLFVLFKKLLQRHEVAPAAVIAFIGVLLFLLSPYTAEVLIWKVCLHYLLSGFFMLIILNLSLRWLDDQSKAVLVLIQLLFFLSLFTLEMAFITPLLILLITLAYYSVRSLSLPRRNSGWILIPMLTMMAGFFILNRILIGDWMGHYGSGTHLRFNVTDVLSNYFRYFIKYLFFTRYFDHPVKMKIFGIAESLPGIAILTSSLLLIFFLMVLFYRKLFSKLKTAVWSGLLFSIALSPVLTLYMVVLLHGENDRYGYQASMFFCMMMAILLSLLPRKLFFISGATLVAVSVFLLVRTISWWNDSNRVYYSLLNDFRWYDRDEVVILNIPDNYKGIFMCRIYREPSSLKEGLQLIRQQPYEGKMYETGYYNMMTPNDSVTVSRDSSGWFITRFGQYHNWWWCAKWGTEDYENEDFKMKIVNGENHVFLKNSAPNRAVIYQAGEKWVEFVNADQTD